MYQPYAQQPSPPLGGGVAPMMPAQQQYMQQVPQQPQFQQQQQFQPQNVPQQAQFQPQMSHMPSYQTVLPASVTPGWNDPPATLPTTAGSANRLSNMRRRPVDPSITGSGPSSYNAYGAQQAPSTYPAGANPYGNSTQYPGQQQPQQQAQYQAYGNPQQQSQQQQQYPGSQQYGM
uniref:Uncharacterized protein n=1 Tax=Caenorhabditis japonica TaxID=281687 RepID=A0A8R1HT86_CAEJA